MPYPTPDSPLFHWLNDSWDHAASPRETKRITKEHLHGRYAHVLGCLAAGLLGGVLMGLFEGGAAAWSGGSFLTPFHRIDGLFRGFFSLAFGATNAALLGIGIHLALSAVFGAFFSVLQRAFTDEESVLDGFFGGIAYGVLIWAFMNYGFILRWSDSSLNQVLSTLPDVFFFAHLLFGACFALAPLLTRKMRGGSGNVKLTPLAKAPPSHAA